MLSRILSALLVASLPVGLGIWGTLVGFGKVPAAQRSSRSEAGRAICRFGGPLLVAAGIWLAVQPLVAPGFGLDWRTYAPTGEQFSIEMPGTPVEATAEETGEYGPVENRLARVFLWRLDVTCSVRRTPLPEGFPDQSPRQIANWERNLVARMAAVNKASIIRNEEVTRAGSVAREFRLDLRNGYICRGELLLHGRTWFELTFTGPEALADSEIAERFLRSFAWNAPPGERSVPEAAGGK